MALFPSSSSTAFEDISRKIYLLRLPLIFLIVFIHARYMEIDDYPDRWMRLLSESVLLGKVPHCAVIFFFVISGYLFTWSEKSGYLNLIQRKGYTLLIPYVIWNTMLMVVHLLCGLLPYKKLLPAFKYAGMTPWQVVVRSYGLDMGMPIDVPLWYVRDLLLLFLVAPLLIWLVRRLRYGSLHCFCWGRLFLWKTVRYFSLRSDCFADIGTSTCDRCRNGGLYSLEHRLVIS